MKKLILPLLAVGLVEADPPLAALNARAKLEHIPEARVAADFVTGTLGIIAAAPTEGRAHRIAARTVIAAPRRLPVVRRCLC